MIKFTNEECDKIISLSNILEKHSSSLWWQGDKTKYHAWHINRNENTEWIFQRLFDYIRENTQVKIIKELDIVHLQNVQSGNKFELHIDKHSEFNVGCCLNDDYGGGELICYNPKIIFPKIKGEIYTFNGDKEHEVKEVTKGERWSLNGFFKIGTTKNKIKSGII